MSSSYIDVPIDTDPQDILNEAFTYLQANIPGWTPAAGNLDVWLLMAIAAQAAESRTVASRVPKSIFRWFGANLISLPPVDAVSATALSTWTMIDTLGHTIPAGTQVTILSGDTPIPFATQVDVVIAPGASVATNVTLVAVTPGAAGSGLGGPGGAVALLDTLSYVLSITQAATTSGGVNAEDDDTYLARLVIQLQLLAPRPILPADFAAFARNIAGVSRATAIDGYNPFHNLMSLNDASVETDASGWTGFGNATVAQSAAQFADGSKSLSITSVAAGDMQAIQIAAAEINVVPGETITAVAYFRSAVTARSCKVGIEWRTAGDVTISDPLGAGVNDTTVGWTLNSYTAVAPATAGKARVFVLIIGPAAGAEVHYIDKMSIRRGSGTDWVPGGTPDTGNARTVAVAAIDAAGNAVSGAIATAIQTDLQARREVNFIVNTLTPNQVIIDVTYDIHLLPGYDSATVIASVNAAIANYLNPATWGATTSNALDWLNTTTIRYLEVAAIINAVTGVDYITTSGGLYNLTMALHGFTMARADITMAGPAPLPTTVGGTLTGTSS